MTKEEIAELQKDKARLDFLADVSQNIANVQLPSDIVLKNLHCLRSAIDEAMEMHKNANSTS